MMLLVKKIIGNGMKLINIIWTEPYKKITFDDWYFSVILYANKINFYFYLYELAGLKLPSAYSGKSRASTRTRKSIG